MNTNLKFNRLLTSGVLLCLALLSGVSQAADNSLLGGDAASGAQQWANNCSRCHNMRDAKEFTDDTWRSIILHMRVRAGLTGKQSRDILAFMQASNFTAVAMPEYSALESDKATPGLTGEKIYTQTCIACHGADGKGTLPGAPDFTATNGPLSKSDDVLLTNIINGFQSPGSVMAMPAKGGNAALSNADINNVLQYLRREIGQ